MGGSLVEYRTLAGIPGSYFDCPCGLGMLSTNSCAAAYKEAMSPVGLKEGRRITCRACPVGALHADVPSNIASASRFLGIGTCSRCHGDARRLIRGSICVSCYNRARGVDWKERQGWSSDFRQGNRDGDDFRPSGCRKNNADSPDGQGHFPP